MRVERGKGHWASDSLTVAMQRQTCLTMKVLFGMALRLMTGFPVTEALIPGEGSRVRNPSCAGLIDRPAAKQP